MKNMADDLCHKIDVPESHKHKADDDADQSGIGGLIVFFFAPWRASC
jgi:hypothetical protein